MDKSVKINGDVFYWDGGIEFDLTKRSCNLCFPVSKKCKNTYWFFQNDIIMAFSDIDLFEECSMEDDNHRMLIEDFVGSVGKNPDEKSEELIKSYFQTCNFNIKFGGVVK